MDKTKGSLWIIPEDDMKVINTELQRIYSNTGLRTVPEMIIETLKSIDSPPDTGRRGREDKLIGIIDNLTRVLLE